MFGWNEIVGKERRGK